MDGTAAQFADFTDPELDASTETEPASRKVKAKRAAGTRPSIQPRPARRHEARAVHQARRPASIMPAALVQTKGPRMSKEKRARMDARRAARLLEEFTPLVRKIAGGFQRKLPRNVLREDLIAAGMSGHGFKLGPAVGEEAAALTMTGNSKLLAPFSLARFN